MLLYHQSQPNFFLHTNTKEFLALTPLLLPSYSPPTPSRPLFALLAPCITRIHPFESVPSPRDSSSIRPLPRDSSSIRVNSCEILSSHSFDSSNSCSKKSVQSVFNKIFRVINGNSCSKSSITLNPKPLTFI